MIFLELPITSSQINGFVDYCFKFPNIKVNLIHYNNVVQVLPMGFHLYLAPYFLQLFLRMIKSYSQVQKFSLRWVENIAGKGENAHYQLFLLFK